MSPLDSRPLSSSLLRFFFKIGAQLVKIYEKIQDVPFIRTRCIHITHTHEQCGSHGRLLRLSYSETLINIYSCKVSSVRPQTVSQQQVSVTTDCMSSLLLFPQLNACKLPHFVYVRSYRLSRIQQFIVVPAKG